jgi:hypothetical protein
VTESRDETQIAMNPALDVPPRAGLNGCSISAFLSSRQPLVAADFSFVTSEARLYAWPSRSLTNVRWLPTNQPAVQQECRRSGQLSLTQINAPSPV